MNKGVKRIIGIFIGLLLWGFFLFKRNLLFMEFIL